MKRGWKIFWIVCAVMLGAGVIFCGIALIMGVTPELIGQRYPHGFAIGSFDNIDDIDDIDDDGEGEDMRGASVLAPNTEKSYDGIREIDLDIYAGEVILQRTDHTKVMVCTENMSRRLGISVKEEDGVLQIKSRKHFLFRYRNPKGKLYIRIPESRKLEQIDLDIGAGILRSDPVACQSFGLDVGAGTAEIFGVQTDELELDCGAGMINASGSAASVDIDCGVGEICYEAEGSEKDYNYDIDCGVGSVTCGSLDSSGIGRENYIDNGSEKNMEISCGVGEVVVTFTNSSKGNADGENSYFEEDPAGQTDGGTDYSGHHEEHEDHF